MIMNNTNPRPKEPKQEIKPPSRLKRKPPKRWCFERDDEGHWYLIPFELQSAFYDMEEACEGGDNLDACNDFTDMFGKMMIGCHPSCYTFTDPKNMLD